MKPDTLYGLHAPIKSSNVAKFLLKNILDALEKPGRGTQLPSNQYDLALADFCWGSLLRRYVASWDVKHVKQQARKYDKQASVLLRSLRDSWFPGGNLGNLSSRVANNVSFSHCSSVMDKRKAVNMVLDSALQTDSISAYLKPSDSQKAFEKRNVTKRGEAPAKLSLLGVALAIQKAEAQREEVEWARIKKEWIRKTQARIDALLSVFDEESDSDSDGDGDGDTSENETMTCSFDSVVPDSVFSDSPARES